MATGPPTITEKGEVIFAEEFDFLLYLCDEIGTKGDNKHVKRESKALLKHKYYWLNKEEDIFFNGMKAVYKILNHQDRVTIKHFNYIRCNHNLDEGFCAMQRILCACNWFVRKMSKLWFPNLDETLHPRYVIKPETCKYSSILGGYNR